MLRIVPLFVASSVWEGESSCGTSVDEIVCCDYS